MKSRLNTGLNWMMDNLGLLRSHMGLRKKLKKEIETLSPWYQPISLGYGLRPVVKDKAGNRYRHWSLDRGVRKWKAFVLPNLPFNLFDKRVLELGCNAGLFLIQCIKQGAREAVGIEKDDHYYRQARFVIKSLGQLYERYHPVRVYQGSIEEFNYEHLGKFDLALLLNVIYHIGKSADYRHLNGDEIAGMQIQTLRKISNVAEYLLFQANPLKDEGRGKGKRSLLELVHRAGLRIIKEKNYDHPRGYILLVKSDNYHKKEIFSITRMVSKYFLPAHKGAEREIVDLYTKYGKEGFDFTKTRYYRLRTGQLDWQDNGVAHLPVSLDINPAYWVMPWCYKYRDLRKKGIRKKIGAFSGVYSKFINLIDFILKGGFDPSAGEIPGYLLVHPDLGEVFVYVDGNQRMGVLSYLADKSFDRDFMVPVQVRQVVERGKLLHYPLTKQLIEEGHFTEKDVFKWFDNVFWFLNNKGA